MLGTAKNSASAFAAVTNAPLAGKSWNSAVGDVVGTRRRVTRRDTKPTRAPNASLINVKGNETGVRETAVGSPSSGGAV